jgi:DNA-dependent RNA polymerase auxiliary subunit epsilon
MRFAYILMSLVFILGFQSPQQFTVQQKELVDLNGDGKIEVIDLLSKKRDSNQEEYEWKLMVEGKQAGIFDNKDELYHLANIEFADLLNKGSQEILLYLKSTGSAETTGLNIFRLNKNETKQIFTDPNTDASNYYENVKKRFQMKYKGNYQVEFIDKLSGLTTTIPLSKDRYKDLPDQEEVKKRLYKIYTWVDPVSNYQFNNVSANKPKEIITLQTVNGISHVDTIAYFKTKYLYNDATETYIPIEVALYSTETNQQLSMKKLQ